MSDLDADAVAAALPDRPLRVYPAMLSSEAEAIAWARAGGQPGALVLAAYQAAARRRGGWPWEVQPDQGLGFSMIASPRGPAGSLYLAASVAVAANLPGETTLAWPDEIRTGESLAGAVSVQENLDSFYPWRVLTVLVAHSPAPRTSLLGDLVGSIEEQSARPPSDVADDYRLNCATLGQRVVARLIPLGPAGATIEGTAAAVRDDGSLVIDTEARGRAAVPPEDVGILEVG
ncbi:MAG: hypothetical protein KY395_04930 [Actinobacteria bacterium]|nr:hypothetical protein [Actinomycetota bacterium]